MLSWMNKLGSIYVYVYLNQHEIDFTKNCDGGCFVLFNSWDCVISRGLV